MKNIIRLLLFISLPDFCVAQDTSPATPVSEKEDQSWYAFTNATICTAPGKYRHGTLLVHRGKIVSITNGNNLPEGTVVTDLAGAFIYPSFIDPYSTAGLPAVKKASKAGPQYDRKNPRDLYWNEAIHPEIRTADLINVVQDSLNSYRNNGFGIINTHHPDGLVRGTSLLTTIGNESLKKELIRPDAALHFSFSKGSSPQDNPSSQMGAIALIRQALYDALWYATAHDTAKVPNASLEALLRYDSLPWIFDAGSKLEVLRAAAIAREFNKHIMVKGAGDEYQRAAALASQPVQLIIPVQLPKPYDVTDPFEAELITLQQLKHWELASHNAHILKNHNIPFAFTMQGLEDSKQFFSNLRKMIMAGASEATLLEALTVSPARMLGVESMAGTLEPGKLANFIVTTDSVFDPNAILLYNYIRGRQFVINKGSYTDLRGQYDLNIDHGKLLLQLHISGERFKPEGKAIRQGQRDSVKVNIGAEGDLITLLIPQDDAWIRLSGKVHNRSTIWDGKGQLPNGDWISWSAIRNSNSPPFMAKDSILPRDSVFAEVIYPFTGYGRSVQPRQQILLIRNATVWTSDTSGVMRGTDVLVRDGRIAALGHSLDVSKIRDPIIFIDGTGKHLTPGIIDEHSHIAISNGVNESSQAITAEVRVGDVINSEDVNIYRQLAGGVTTSQLLHGSANPVGGQSALIKLRWGKLPEEMKVHQAPGFIKFALGENVKQANWGEKYRERFPQTRMGVEQVFYDAFYRARRYQAEWDIYNAIPERERRKKNIPPPRKDLELEALAEILKGQRFITCHSYVQPEILMLMQVADSMGFRVNTFTHILEGYKVAQKMKEHGAAASTFSDWWAYKWEVNDAIPFNAALLNSTGVLTAINSDDAEMGRRLNQEAAKTIKYGNVTEEDALKMITINPAKMLHIDGFTGSITAGKDADLVLWSGHPLSVTSVAEKTIIDGIVYYDRETDLEMRKWIERERARIISLMITAREKGEATVKVKLQPKRNYHCDTLEP